jgi:hypothetical protein
VIYFIRCHATGHTKIGKADDPRARLRGLQTGSPSRLDLVGTLPGDRSEEARLHRLFDARRVRGEWFDLNSDELASALCGESPPPRSDASAESSSPARAPTLSLPAFVRPALDRFRAAPTPERALTLLKMIAGEAFPSDDDLGRVLSRTAEEARAVDRVRTVVGTWRRIGLAQRASTFGDVIQIRGLGFRSVGLLVSIMAG